MANLFNPDFKDFIKCLEKYEVKYVLVGGYSVIIHGYNRTTGDMDIWVNRSVENYKNIVKAFVDFGLPTFDMTEDNFMNSNYDVFRFGKPPCRIDLMTHVLGLDFKDVHENSFLYEEEDLKIRVIHINDLRKAKQSSARHKDLDDLENL